MRLSESLERAEKLLAASEETLSRPAPDRLDVRLAVDDLLATIETIHNAQWGYLSTITGLHHAAKDAEADSTVEVLYHFCEGAAILTLRVTLAAEKPRVPSICGVIPSAILLERELREMFGIDVMDIPDTSRLFLADDWPEGLFPLRKDAALGANNGH